MYICNNVNNNVIKQKDIFPTLIHIYILCSVTHITYIRKSLLILLHRTLYKHTQTPERTDTTHHINMQLYIHEIKIPLEAVFMQTAYIDSNIALFLINPHLMYRKIIYLQLICARLVVLL